MTDTVGGCSQYQTLNYYLQKEQKGHTRASVFSMAGLLPPDPNHWVNCIPKIDLRRNVWQAPTSTGSWSDDESKCKQSYNTVFLKPANFKNWPIIWSHGWVINSLKKCGTQSDVATGYVNTLIRLVDVCSAF